MADPSYGFQPGQSPSDRRAAFDLRRILRKIMTALGADGPGGEPRAALGVVAVGTMAGGSVDVLLGAQANLATGLQFTLQEGRRYRLVFQTRASQPLAAGTGAGIFEILDGAALFAAGDVWWISPAAYASLRGEWFIDGDGVARNFSMRVAVSAGPAAGTRFFVETAGNNRFYLEDVGPA